MRISEKKKTNEKFLRIPIFTVKPVKNLSVNIHVKKNFFFFLLEYSLHFSVHSWDRLKIFLNVVSFTQKGGGRRFTILLHFNSYFAPQFRLNILYAPFQRASTRTNPTSACMRYFYARFCYTPTIEPIELPLRVC